LEESLSKERFILYDRGMGALPREEIWLPKPATTFEPSSKWFTKEQQKETPFLNRQLLLFNTLKAMYESWTRTSPAWKRKFALIATSPGSSMKNTHTMKVLSMYSQFYLLTTLVFSGYGKTRFIEEFIYRCFNDPSIWQNFVLKGEYDTEVLPWDKFQEKLKSELSEVGTNLRADFINVLFDSVFSGRFFGLDGVALALYAYEDKERKSLQKRIANGNSFMNVLLC